MSDRITATLGDSREVLKSFPGNHFDSCVTDPPYALVSIVKRFGGKNAAPAQEGADGRYQRASAGFMGQTWDTGETAFDPEFWREVYRVLKPGAHLAAFSGTRTYHRMAVAIEDAGFEIRDQIGWAYGSGFPKSHDVSKGIDRTAGVVRETIPTGPPVKRMIPGADQNESGWEKTDGREYVPNVSRAVSPEAKEWEGWGTALKPAWEPICLARKPLIGTVAENVLAHRTGAINIDGCRVEIDPAVDDPRLGGAGSWTTTQEQGGHTVSLPRGSVASSPKGRWPANLIHDGSDEVLAAFPDTESSRGIKGGTSPNPMSWNQSRADASAVSGFTDSGSAARFFYTAKADADDRLGSGHPTVKPLDLMQWLVRLVTPPGGLVLEPFAGTGTTGEAAFREGMRCQMIEREAKFHADIMRRIGLMESSQTERRRESMKAKIVDGRIAKNKIAPAPLFKDHE